jgi:hypothetical protein
LAENSAGDSLVAAKNNETFPAIEKKSEMPDESASENAVGNVNLDESKPAKEDENMMLPEGPQNKGLRLFFVEKCKFVKKKQKFFRIMKKIHANFSGIKDKLKGLKGKAKGLKDKAKDKLRGLKDKKGGKAGGKYLKLCEKCKNEKKSEVSKNMKISHFRPERQSQGTERFA